MRLALIVLMLGPLAGSAISQEADSALAVLSVFTEPEGAQVFVDSAFIGRSPVEGLGAPAGRHVVRVVYPSAVEWNAISLCDTLVLTVGERVTRRYVLGIFVRLQTVPPGAVVALGDSALGVTPCIVRSINPAVLNLVVRKEGYRDTTISLMVQNDFVRILLPPHSQSLSPSQGTPALRTREHERGGAWATYAAAASTVGFGIATAYLQHEANRNYDLYVSTGDPRYHDTTRKYDRTSAWTLVLTELSFGVLAYLLLTQ